MAPPTATAEGALSSPKKFKSSSKKHKGSSKKSDDSSKRPKRSGEGREAMALPAATASMLPPPTTSPGRLLPVRPRFEPGPAFSRLPAPTETAPSIGGSGKELWLLQLPPDWDFSTELRLTRPATGAPEDVLGVTAATAAGTSYSLVADDPSTADGLFAFVRGGGGGGGGGGAASSSLPPSSSLGPSAITRRATLLVDAMPSRLLSDVKSEKETRKKDKKEKKEKKKEKRKEKQ